MKENVRVRAFLNFCRYYRSTFKVYGKGLFFSASLEYSDNRWLGVDFVSCLPNHKFPVRVESKKALAVVGEFHAKKELKWHIYVSQFATICHFAKLHKIQSLCVC